jgi:hypothetical protein
MTTIIRSAHIDEIAPGYILVTVKLIINKTPITYVHHVHDAEPDSIAPENAYDLISAAISAALAERL